MNIKNQIKGREEISVYIENDTLDVTAGGSGNEYAVFVTYSYGEEKMLDIIKNGSRSFKIGDCNDIREIKLVDIYIDEEVFRHIFPQKKENIHINEKKAENEEIIISEKEENERKAEMNDTKTPPPLITKRREISKTDMTFLDKLPTFGGFDCELPEGNMRIFDEDIIRKENIKVNYNGMKVPAMYPYLSYSDKSSEGSSLPKRIIGSMKINNKTYLTYGILTDIKRGIQPFFGTTGFVYLVPYDHKYAYWMMYLDIDSGKVSYPYDENLMQAE